MGPAPESAGAALVWKEALRHAQGHLAALVGALDESDLAAPSYCDDWTVAQVLSHVGSGSEIFGLLLDAGVAGTGAPEPSAFPAVWERWNAMAPVAQAAAAVAASEALVARLGGLDDATWDGVHVAAFGLDITAPLLCQMRLAELALHTWDVETAVEEGPRLSDEVAGLLVDALGPLVGRIARPSTEALTVRVTTSGPDRRLALLTADPVTLGPWGERPDADADAELALPAESFVRLVYGRFDADDAGVRFDPGASAFGLADFQDMFPGF